MLFIHSICICKMFILDSGWVYMSESLVQSFGFYAFILILAGGFYTWTMCLIRFLAIVQFQFNNIYISYSMQWGKSLISVFDARWRGSIKSYLLSNRATTVTTRLFVAQSRCLSIVLSCMIEYIRSCQKKREKEKRSNRNAVNISKKKIPSHPWPIQSGEEVLLNVCI